MRPNNRTFGIVEKIGFGGGCHWCTEAVFAALRGVHRVEQGFIASDAPDDNFSEAVIAHFDPDDIPLSALVEIHLRTHSSTSAHSMRGKYRSAIYVFSMNQEQQAQASIGQSQDGFDEKVITRVLPFREFRASDERFQNYYEKNEGRPFCTRYIDPKLDYLRREYSAQLTAT